MRLPFILSEHTLTHPFPRCVGVWETVGSVGLPEELAIHSEKTTSLLGFRDKKLGPHVERAYHALALNEPRADFVRLAFAGQSCPG